MMTSKELRVGNWVYNETTRENIEVYPMMIPQLNRLDGTSHNIKPIPLTEELLLKCGFYHKGSGFYCYAINDWSNIQIHFYKENCITEISVQKHSFVAKCEHIHQLQNLYFSLTGKELEIKF